MLFIWDISTNIIILCSNIVFLMCGYIYKRGLKGFRDINYIIMYFLLFMVLIVLARRPYMFVLFNILLAGGFHIRGLVLFIVSILIFILIAPAYWLGLSITAGLILYISIMIYRQIDNNRDMVFLVVGFLFFGIMLLPLVNMFLQFTPQTLIASFDSGAKNALMISLLSSAISTFILILLGTPLAYVMARKRFYGRAFMDALIDIPIVIPQTAVGIALLMLLAPKTPLGDFVYRLSGIRFAGSFIGIVVCQVFVSSPFFIRSAMQAFELVDRRFENVARSLGATPMHVFLRVVLPMAFPGIFNGMILSFSRALSEMGSIFIVAYRPHTIPIYIGDIFEQYGISEAAPISVVFVIITLWVFIALKWMYEIRKGALERV